MFTLENNNCMYLIDGDRNTTKVIFFQEKELFPRNF